MHFKSNSQSFLFFDEKGAVCLFYVTSTAKIHGKCPDLLVYLFLFGPVNANYSERYFIENWHFCGFVEEKYRATCQPVLDFCGFAFESDWTFAVITSCIPSLL